MKNIIRHGEVILKEAELPKGAKLEKKTRKYVVAHSETGHHHVLESVDNYEIFTHDGDTYVRLGTVGTLFHEKSGPDVHTPHKVKPSTYKIVIKREFDYFSNALRRVRD